MKNTKLAAMVALMFTSASAFAAEYDNTITAGYGYISVNSQSTNLTSNGPAFLTPQPAGLEVGDASTLVLSYVRRLNDVWDLEFAVGLPPKHDVKGTGTLGPYGTVSTIKQVSPTILANYKFRSPSDKLRPIVGLGFNFTKFIGRQSTDSGNLASGGPTRIDLTNSFGLAAHIGVNYAYDEHWVINAGVATARVKTDLKATTGSVQRYTSFNLRPVLFSVSAGYKF